MYMETVLLHKRAPIVMLERQKLRMTVGEDKVGNYNENISSTDSEVSNARLLICFII